MKLHAIVPAVGFTPQRQALPLFEVHAEVPPLDIGLLQFAFWQSHHLGSGYPTSLRLDACGRPIGLRQRRGNLQSAVQFFGASSYIAVQFRFERLVDERERSITVV